MGRAPCCEKTGLKKGPWSYVEDQILINHINLHGHGNWRALPKQAGLLRCGKSCRLRWSNYLRPDIKRGNFTKEEEDAIIMLHQNMGNRWSAIAGKLPGRTDNEIKNVWHTHLKKQTLCFEAKQDSRKKKKKDFHFPRKEEKIKHQSCQISSSSQTFSGNETSTVTGVETENMIGSQSEFPQIGEGFWSEVLSPECSATVPTLNATDDPELEFLASFFKMELPRPSREDGSGSVFCGDGMQFWRDLLNGAEGLPEF